MIDSADYPFSQRLRQLRLSEQLSAAELGRKINYAPSHIFNIEAGRENGGPAFLDALCGYFHSDVEELTKRYDAQVKNHALTLVDRNKRHAYRQRLVSNPDPLVGGWFVTWQCPSPNKPFYCSELVDLRAEHGPKFNMVKNLDPKQNLGEAMHPEPWQALCWIDATNRMKGGYECIDRSRPRIDGQFYLTVLPDEQLMLGTWTGLTEEHLHAVGLIVFARDLAESRVKITEMRERYGFLPFVFNPLSAGTAA